MSGAEIEVSNAAWGSVEADWLVVGVFEDSEPSDRLQELDAALSGQLTQLRERGDLKGKPGEMLLLPVAPGIAAQRLVLVGLGPVASLSAGRLEQAWLTAVRKAAGTADSSIALTVPKEAVEQLGAHRAGEIAGCAAAVGSVSQSLYKKEPDRYPFTAIRLLADEPSAAVAEGARRGRILGDAMNITRDLVNRHPEEIVPASFGERAAQIAAQAGLKCEVHDERWIAHERMQSLLAVARGSDHAPRVVVLEYRGGDEAAPLLALCGKGVTFDSGGLSIKPSASMLTMKADMAGAATVLGAMVAMAQLKLPVNVIGVLGLVENMVGPKSFKLGEVLTARNGVTIEVQNTDAEGRLVLADVMSFAVDQKPAKMIDLATLTGACMVALGEEVAGAFSNNQPWCDDVLAAARRAGEDLWQMPMFESYAEQLKCDFADVKNIGGKWGGAITAAKFLERFVDDVPWVHLDIAGPSYAECGKPYRDVGATGSSVRTLVEAAAALGTQGE